MKTLETTSVRDAFGELPPATRDELARRLLEAARLVDPSVAGIAAVERIPLDSSWYRTERVIVRFDSGAVLDCFVKDFGSYAAAKGRMPERRARELYFYEEVFRSGELGLPSLICTVPVEADARWLLLEFVDGAPLAWCGLDVWYEAAAWLGRFQSAIADRRSALAQSGRFTEHAARYFENIARRARDGASRYGRGLETLVDDVLSSFEELAGALMRQPQTLVHGAFRPAGILVDEKRVPPRICPIDWEIAALGSCLYDLAVLADGFEGAELETFLARFLSTATWLRSAPPDLADLETSVRACRMARTMKWIAQGEARGMSEENVRTLAESLAVTAGAADE